MQARPLVSVITPSFNSAKYIPRAVNCVRCQNYPVEHIIVDDCSTDESWAVLMALSRDYPWLVPVRLEVNCGPVVARNKALELARGRFVAFLDVDDVWLPSKTAIQSEFMLNNSSYFSFTDYRFMSSDGLKVGRVVRGRDFVDRETHFSTREGLGCLTVMIDFEKFHDFRFEFTNPITNRAEDFWAWAEVLRRTHASRVPHDLARYSVVPGSRSANFLYKARVVYQIYRYVEKMPLSRFFKNYSGFLISAVKKRITAKPNLDINVIDGHLGHDWIESVKLPRL